MKAFTKLQAIILFFLGFSSCINYNEPHYDYLDACFNTSMTEYMVGQTVYFNNCSSGADSYYWDFGDGMSSNQSNPVHEFQNPGTYQVKLTVYNGGGRSSASKFIYITGSTKLDVLVMYYGTSDPVTDCEVTLYGTRQNWVDLQNPLITITTGASGNVIFSELEPVEYFVDAYRSVDDTTFYCNENFDPSTGILAENVVNLMDVYVEMLFSKKKDGTKEKRFVVREIRLQRDIKENKFRASHAKRGKM